MQLNTRSRIPINLIVLFATLAVATADAQDSPIGASLRAKEAESLSMLTAEGKLLYESDATKRGGYEYCSMANALAERGEFREAVRAASRALFLGITERNDDLVAQAERDLALVYSYAGQLDRAQEYAEGALKHVVRDHAKVFGPAYKTLGDVAARRGRYQEALEDYKRAADISESSFRHLIMVAMANAALANGDRKAALEYLAATEGDSTGVVARGVARTKAEIALAENRTDEAVSLFQSVKVRASADDPYDRIWRWYGIARAKRNASNAEGAAAAFAQSIQELERLRAKFHSEEIKTGVFGDLQRIFDDALELALERQQIEAAWGLSEQSRGRALLDMVRGRVELASGTTAFAEAAATRTRPSDVQAWLKADEALVEFLVLLAATHVWILRKDSLVHRRIEIGHDALARQIEAFRDATVMRRPNALALGDQLYALLIEPLGLGARERVIIVGHDALHYVPFQALRVNGKYLIETHALSYAPSANAFIVLRALAVGDAKSMLALGNPTAGAGSVAGRRARGRANQGSLPRGGHISWHRCDQGSSGFGRSRIAVHTRGRPRGNGHARPVALNVTAGRDGKNNWQFRGKRSL